jgi:molybdopterin-guanine dinucleotide biosynthesis adapter protein
MKGLPVFGITGWKNSGKTTLMERLIAELTGRGLAVATIKHAHHGFDVDKEGTDSFRHRMAGAREVAIASDRRWALMHELKSEDEPRLEDILARLSPVDLVLVEGYKRDNHPKLEARRRQSASREPLAANAPNIVVVAADYAIEEGNLPVFDLDDVPAIADFILGYLRIEAPRAVKAS